jgi:MFS transporter, putative metabolite:H+ symporter
MGPTLVILAGALGYFVDIFDLVLFGMVRQASLRELGVAESELLPVGITLQNCQMAGMLVGGLVWGILGDKRGRVKVLFGSIALYSLANLLNAGATSLQSYGVLRFLAGVGLAGELGAAVTLVLEAMSRRQRGYGTMVVAGVGFMGAVAAALLSDRVSWRTSYFVGGILGLALLVFRWKVLESALYLRSPSAGRGDLTLFFKKRERGIRYLACIGAGLPIYFVAGLLTPFSPEIGKALDVGVPVSVSKVMLFSFLGVALGDFLTGWRSQRRESRKRVMGEALVALFAVVLIFLSVKGQGIATVYGLYFLMGITAGYWAVLITLSSEQFGTNLRSTVATTVPNFVRASVIPMSLGFKALVVKWGLIPSLQVFLSLVTAIALISLLGLEETYGRDLEFQEE